MDYSLTRIKRNNFLSSLFLSAVQKFLTMFSGEARLDVMRGARESKGNLVLTRLSYNCQSEVAVQHKREGANDGYHVETS